MWLLSSFLHIFYAERLAAYVALTVPYTAPDYSGIKKQPIKTCKIPRGSMTENQYKIACEAIEKADRAKSGAQSGADAEFEDEEGDEKFADEEEEVDSAF